MKAKVDNEMLIAGLFLTGIIALSFFATHTRANDKRNSQSGSEAVNTQNIPEQTLSSSKQVVPEIVIATSTSSSTQEKVVAKPKKVYGTYIEVVDSCGIHYNGVCLSLRNGPGTEYEKVGALRDGMVLKTSGTVTASDGSLWYKIVYDEWIRYPDRMGKEQYVSADYVRKISSYKETGSQKTDKKIIVDRGEQMLYAYEGDALFMKQSVSTGKDGTVTPRGTFTIFSKTPSRYMQGPIPGISDDSYDLPGVPWTMYFTEQGAAFHGAYWHDSFGQQWSHGCVNLPVNKAEDLYDWADIGTVVVVRD